MILILDLLGTTEANGGAIVCKAIFLFYFFVLTAINKRWNNSNGVLDY